MSWLDEIVQHRGGDRTESNSHESPVSEGEELGQWVEWDVASWTLWVMVRRAHLRAGGVEATAGDHRGRGGGTDCCS